MNEIIQLVSDIVTLVTSTIIQGLAVYLVFHLIKNIEKILKGVINREP